MHHQIRTLLFSALDRLSGGKTAALLAVTLGLSACQPQIQTPSDLLFAPTFSKSWSAIPRPAGTQYDCRTFKGSGWEGITGGVIYDSDRRYNMSQAGCFKTKPECEAYLMLMRGYIDQPRFIKCRPITKT
ncbi:MAG: hypothetical protein ABJL55_12755 [Roseibium sp.]